WTDGGDRVHRGLIASRSQPHHRHGGREHHSTYQPGTGGHLWSTRSFPANRSDARGEPNAGRYFQREIAALEGGSPRRLGLPTVGERSRVSSICVSALFRESPSFYVHARGKLLRADLGG